MKKCVKSGIVVGIALPVHNVYSCVGFSIVWIYVTLLWLLRQVDLINDLAVDYPHLADQVTAHYGDDTQSLNLAVKENLLRLEIYYDRISKTEVVQTPAVTDFQFISDVGELFIYSFRKILLKACE